jgi:hypothetical protein
VRDGFLGASELIVIIDRQWRTSAALRLSVPAKDATIERTNEYAEARPEPTKARAGFLFFRDYSMGTKRWPGRTGRRVAMFSLVHAAAVSCWGVALV